MGIKSSNRVNQFNISTSINMIKIVLISPASSPSPWHRSNKLTMFSPSTLDLATTDILCWELDMGIQANYHGYHGYKPCHYPAYGNYYGNYYNPYRPVRPCYGYACILRNNNADNN